MPFECGVRRLATLVLDGHGSVVCLKGFAMRKRIAPLASIVSMRDIAREAGVSVATVSYVVNGREDKVGETTRKKVLAIISRRDYQPNQLMRAVRTRRSHVVGILVPSFRTTFFPAIIDAIESTLADRGYHAVMCQNHSDVAMTRDILSMMRQRRVDGLIAVPRYDEAGLYAKSLESGMNIVFVGASYPHLPIPSVEPDDLLGSCLVMRHLLDRGHRRIATMRHGDDFLFGGFKDRFEGYCRELAAAGIPLATELVGIMGSGSLRQEACLAIRDLLLDNRASAFFAPSDNDALEIMRLAHEAGRAIPRDFAVVGYGNQAAGVHTTPTLSTVDQRPDIVGRLAVDIVLQQIESGSPSQFQRHLVEPRLLTRESS